jgi:hypothetical protein
LITENTVIIVGAGASTPYGYPTGKELLQQICDEFPKQLHRLLTGQPLMNRDASPKEVQDAMDFAGAFRDARVRSIDRYLAINDEFSSIGKLAIAMAILEVEKKPRFGDDLNDNWYFYLYNRMLDGCRTADSYGHFGDNKVTFITFNYDRSLEHYLFKSLRNTFRKAPEAAIVEQLKRIPVHHVYGQVDYLPWQGGKKLYGAKYGHEEIAGVISNIKTMFEMTAPEKEDLKRMIGSTRRIYFLGFGYDESNMRIIGLPDAIGPGHHISGTYTGAKPKEVNDVTVFLTRRSGINPKLVNFPDCGCVDLLRAYI